jgi:hypothetical protein
MRKVAFVSVMMLTTLATPEARAAGAAPAKAPAPADAPARILGEALTGDGAWRKLAHLTDRIGHRLSGSPGLERAIAWASETMKADGVDRVWTETVKVPHWERGAARARIVSPVEAEMAVLALGGSVATPSGGLEANVVPVGDFEQLEALGDKVAGSIVLFDRAMEVGAGKENGYGSLSKLRTEGASRAAKQGAVAMLIRSLGTASFRLPHTGAQRYEEGGKQIPAAAISAEDAQRIDRLVAAGETVRVRLELGCRTHEDADSANVLGDIRGSELPDEIVLIGAHLDSWDVGQGAHDDGAGVAMVMESLAIVKRLGLVPRRTIRGVLFTNEENGLRGGRDYAARHGSDRHVVAIETDSGGFRPEGFRVTAGEGGVDLMKRLAAPLAGLGAARIGDGGGGADIGPLRKLGVPIGNLDVAGDRYFDYHHTEADTLDKVDPNALREAVAALAVMAWQLANAEETLPAPPPEAEAAPAK